MDVLSMVLVVDMDRRHWLDFWAPLAESPGLAVGLNGPKNAL